MLEGHLNITEAVAEFCYMYMKDSIVFKVVKKGPTAQTSSHTGLTVRGLLS